MKVVVIGTRGIPNIQGGVETHCEQLYPRLVQLGCQVVVIRRSAYITRNNQLDEYRGVKLLDVFSPHRKSLEAIVHSMLAVFRAWRMHPDVVHIHAIGPSLVIPLARLLGMKVVTTNHGPDYNRQKWGSIAKAVLRAGEWCQGHWANKIIAISQSIQNDLATKYHCADRINLIHNGVESPIKISTTQYISTFGLQPKGYILAVARFVPEKRLDWLIEAYSQINTQLKLVIAGDADHPSEYATALKTKAKEHNIILTGFIKGEKLHELQTHAALFVLPSTHEGLPIALLEAMSYGTDVLLSNIEANRLPELDPDDFFEVDNMPALISTLQRKADEAPRPRTYDLRAYDWDHIARQTLLTYKEILK